MGSLPAKGADNLGIPRRAHRAGGIAGGGGAVRYHLEYLCAYSVESDPIDGVDKNYGVLYTATIETFEELPPMEMAEMRLFAELPTNMTYPQLQPKMALYAENVGKWKKEKGTP